MINSPFQYRLRAAVTHYGSHGNGHYVCYRPHPKAAPQPECREDVQVSSTEEDTEGPSALSTPEDREEIQGELWWRFSDDSVYAVSESEAHQGNVFMLFYERIDELAPLTTQVADTVAESTPVAEEAPLPPSDVVTSALVAVDGEAVGVALPDDDDDNDLLDLIPPISSPSVQPTHPKSIPAQLSAQEHNTSLPTMKSSMDTSLPTPHETETEMSDAESEDAPSTQLTSDNESEVDVPTPPKSVPVPQISPHLMRTAGNAASRGQGNRQSLPLVSAT
jgi:ubiquitin carboxyl-terminal hydrolase 1